VEKTSLHDYKSGEIAVMQTIYYFSNHGFIILVLAVYESMRGMVHCMRYAQCRTLQSECFYICSAGDEAGGLRRCEHLDRNSGMFGQSFMTASRHKIDIRPAAGRSMLV